MLSDVDKSLDSLIDLRLHSNMQYQSRKELSDEINQRLLVLRKSKVRLVGPIKVVNDVDRPEHAEKEEDLDSENQLQLEERRQVSLVSEVPSQISRPFLAQMGRSRRLVDL